MLAEIVHECLMIHIFFRVCVCAFGILCVRVCACDQLQDEERRRKQQLEEIRKREAEERAKQEEERRWREEERAKREAEEKVSLSVCEMIAG